MKADQQALEEAQARLDQRRKEAEVAAPKRMGASELMLHCERMAAQHARAHELGEAFRSGDREAVKALQPPPRPKSEIREERRQKLLRQFGVPRAYLGATRASWQTTWDGAPSPWPTAVDGWAGGPWSVLLIGEPGVGKTHVAVSLMQEFVRARWAQLDKGRLSKVPKRVCFVSVPIACQEIRDAYADNNHEVAARYTKIASSCDLVVYDDVGAQPDKENWLQVVSGWVYVRHLHLLPTILTANEVEHAGLDERTSRRVGGGLVVGMGQKSEAPNS